MSFVEPSRRQILQCLAATAPLAAILADPGLARAAAAGLEDVSLQTAGGRRCTRRLPSRRTRQLPPYC